GGGEGEGEGDMDRDRRRRHGRAAGRARRLPFDHRAAGWPPASRPPVTRRPAAAASRGHVACCAADSFAAGDAMRPEFSRSVAWGGLSPPDDDGRIGGDDGVPLEAERIEYRIELGGPRDGTRDRRRATGGVQPAPMAPFGSSGAAPGGASGGGRSIGRIVT
ncbi:hypothetical protein NX868_23385, partial [Burkholderia thailandensis]|nr:hypothetical protein [Burkholderia thailandensis]